MNSKAEISPSLVVVACAGDAPRAYDAPVSSRFMFVQFEFTHAIGPSAGRYVVSGPDGAAQPADELDRRARLTGVTMQAATADVLAITVVPAAPARRQPLRRRARAADPDEPAAEVPLLLVTFIRGTAPLAGKREADAILRALANDEEAQQAWVADGLAVVNRAIRAYRAGAGDPYVTEVAQRDARAVRIGYGSTDDVPSGRFDRAVRLPPPPVTSRRVSSAWRRRRSSPTTSRGGARSSKPRTSSAARTSTSTTGGCAPRRTRSALRWSCSRSRSAATSRRCARRPTSSSRARPGTRTTTASPPTSSR